VVTQQYVPDDLINVDYYRPGEHGAERAVASRLPLLRRIVRGGSAPRRAEAKDGGADVTIADVNVTEGADGSAGEEQE
jgi:putative ATPase